MTVQYVTSAAGRFRMLGSLLFFLVLALLPFVWHSLKATFSGSKDGRHGTWVGHVTLSTLRRGEFGGAAEDIPSGQAILFLSIKPIALSYLDRDKVEAELTDAEGHKLVLDVVTLRDDWRVPWSGRTDSLLGAPPVDTLVGTWNGSVSPFQLTVGSRFPFPKDHPLSDHIQFRIAGTLESGDRVAYNRLVAAQQKSTPQ